MPTPDGALWEDVYFASSDDLRLHARYYPASGRKGRPVLCLPGLTRNGRDFHDLAVHLSTDAGRPRDVYALDMRGRGLSQSDRNWRNYTHIVELQDVLDFMAIADLHGAAIVGTSRGGMIATAMAVARPAALGAVVLNDIGPVMETRGLARIASYVGKIPIPPSWAAATALVREMNERAFPAVPDEQWAEVAKALFNEEDGRPAQGYDPALANGFDGLDLTQPMPALWGQFAALHGVPALVLRGANSDILSAETVEEMVRRHPNMNAFTVAGQGHAPLLKDAQTIEVIARFLAAND